MPTGLVREQESREKQKICVFAGFLTGIVYIAAKFLSLGPYQVTIVTPKKLSYKNTDHENTLQFLLQDSSLELMEPGQLDRNSSFSALFLLWPHAHTYNQSELADLKERIRNCGKVIALYHRTHKTRLRHIKRQVKELAIAAQVITRFDVILHEEVPLNSGIYSLWVKSNFVGAGPHAQFLSNPELQAAMFSDWEINRQRLFKLNFLGTRAPDRRAAILGQIEQFYKVRADINLTSVGDSVDDSKSNVLWIADTNSSKRVRIATEYLGMLEDSDFSLAPAGYTRWTNRPYEALTRGSIPIIDNDESRCFCLNFRDGENCLLVKNKDWISAVQRALAMPPDAVQRMRTNIKAMTGSQLTFAALSKRLRARAGLE